MSEVDINTQNKLDYLLAAFYLFSNLGRNEVSISEFQESIREFQRAFPLGYSFSDRFLLSTDLLYDIKILDNKGYIRDYHYRLDGLLPKRFLALTILGRGAGKKALEILSTEITENLTEAVERAISNYKKRWRLWVR
ncbi:MAG: hypothetical protein JW762_06550 [Dehalococcoidales bacterium]|nr:hypothetical protein [Dehalococcoidales bacterium]